ncbi:tetratricopeptide (TPR) repeat protein [Dysgonomonas sp. PH5-45]|uniref:tetratricopeptide repeat protein n=1 Tax=unclassified Dysgonomonas TaxID=2630389 RepID=UPI002475FE68|nr:MULTISPECIES: tetratricopeptide repeat protein [unclassified Dysgonomonas]MDH6353842.1 tetratricopeptide (TPR) repeat protein [Dysgonomonas sp. PH5-45]MDH6386744.1 tetratricopeptide (TPR) repeat protein [Dysgonomonas sp. PH5-37]
MKRFALICSLLLLFAYCLQAQASDVLIKANALFEGKNYKEATRLYEQAYQEKPDEATAFKYGVSLFEARIDVNKAIVLLQSAAKKNKEAYLYLGDAYTDLYRFAEAGKEYDQYLKLSRREKNAPALISERKEKMNDLRKLVNRAENIRIVDSVVVNKRNLLSAYHLSHSGGKLDYFNNVFDANQSVTSTVYYNEKGSKIYFAQPGEAHYSLFSMDKLIDGFGNEKKLDAQNFGIQGNVNYVFVMPDGVTTYFSAESTEGIGGYDLYVTRYNMNNDTYLTPERMNMPFNSRYNDYLMVIDEEKGVGWFASDRFQPEGMVCVYTFIPNKEVEIVESEDDLYKANRARIGSIKDSWERGADYSKLIALARKAPAVKTEEKKDFEFIVNDKYTYYTLKDFRNPSARSTYQKVNSLQKELAKLEDALTKQRNIYANASANDKRSLSTEILRMEKEQERIYTETQKLETTARNEEIKALK